jgi:polar amino acid transport system permease protein
MPEFPQLRFLRPGFTQPIAGLDRTGVKAATTDLPVLLPPGDRLTRPAFMPPRIELKAWHGLVLAAVFMLSLGISDVYAQASGTRESLFTTFVRWVPFVLWGFVLNLVISFFAMAIGTVAGAALGLMQVSLLAPVRGGSWVVTQFFRNSPWLVLLFCIMLLLPFQITVFGVEFDIPDWLKATIGFSLPVMANISEVVRGAVRSIPSGQWESAESLAFSRRQTMWMIILPQCIKRMIPPWMNWYAILTMATPLASIMGVEEAVTHSQQAMAAEGSRPELLGPFYSFLLVIFFLYCYPIARWTISLERRFTVKI